LSPEENPVRLDTNSACIPRGRRPRRTDIRSAGATGTPICPPTPVFLWDVSPSTSLARALPFGPRIVATAKASGMVCTRIRTGTDRASVSPWFGRCPQLPMRP